MSEKLFRSTKVIVQCVDTGKHKTPESPAVAPKVEEAPVGTVFKAKDFSKEEFTTFFNDGTLVEHEAVAQDAASAYYDTTANGPLAPEVTSTGEVKETEDQRKERLLNEAKTLGVAGVTKNMKSETIEAKIAEHKNTRDDGTVPSTQDGAGRENPSEGEGPEGGAPSTGDENEDLLG